MISGRSNNSWCDFAMNLCGNENKTLKFPKVLQLHFVDLKFIK